jgi:hypothetical protein
MPSKRSSREALLFLPRAAAGRPHPEGIQGGVREAAVASSPENLQYSQHTASPCASASKSAASACGPHLRTENDWRLPCGRFVCISVEDLVAFRHSVVGNEWRPGCLKRRHAHTFHAVVSFRQVKSTAASHAR